MNETNSKPRSHLIGLRVDVDTFRGTKLGIPTLLSVLEKHHIKATFYFSVGPDNMGRHLWRLLKPAFLIKMLRSNAAGLYGPEIIFMGTLWRGPLIGKKLEKQIKSVSDAGHEIGLHAWDHHKIQSKIDKLNEEKLHDLIKKGYDEIKRITGKPPITSAAPGWRCSNAMLKAKTAFPFKFNSDCRGTHIFKPDIQSVKPQIQIPATLPTYDELIGANGVNNDNYNLCLKNKLSPDKLNVLTIHAEVEGGKCRHYFDEFLTETINEGWNFVPLGTLLPEDLSIIPHGIIEKSSFPGREGWLALQK